MHQYQVYIPRIFLKHSVLVEGLLHHYKILNHHLWKNNSQNLLVGKDEIVVFWSNKFHCFNLDQSNWALHFDSPKFWSVWRLKSTCRQETQLRLQTRNIFIIHLLIIFGSTGGKVPSPHATVCCRCNARCHKKVAIIFMTLRFPPNDWHSKRHKFVTSSSNQCQIQNKADMLFWPNLYFLVFRKTQTAAEFFQLCGFQ